MFHYIVSFGLDTFREQGIIFWLSALEYEFGEIN